ncbi:hypothetical protein K437DRAFT_87147 [Tilletiaria anomala UBC 951]|uniref:Uncharacterized protein n=1 Tax=Tilletiaria anomala (strain ATCC 24038 / CBS 436.72 / UBC 951) TaxID=1037660 RepID=A0A066W6J4_TILAU|nr:uncharacterized protein K437DRAFT_87147 [Tilletiaria anomala UBC 951]KDN48173.1 hypothetical protein K437DRAFT_87147 [Tilletiaria anomala UBC 951]
MMSGRKLFGKTRIEIAISSQRATNTFPWPCNGGPVRFSQFNPKDRRWKRMTYADIMYVPDDVTSLISTRVATRAKGGGLRKGHMSPSRTAVATSEFPATSSTRSRPCAPGRLICLSPPSPAHSLQPQSRTNVPRFGCGRDDLTHAGRVVISAACEHAQRQGIAKQGLT